MGVRDLFSLAFSPFSFFSRDLFGTQVRDISYLDIAEEYCTLERLDVGEFSSGAVPPPYIRLCSASSSHCRWRFHVVLCGIQHASRNDARRWPGGFGRGSEYSETSLPASVSSFLKSDIPQPSSLRDHMSSSPTSAIVRVARCQRYSASKASQFLGWLLELWDGP